MRPRRPVFSQVGVPLVLALSPGCYLVASGKIDQTCEDLDGGCAGGDGADGAAGGDLDRDGYTVDQGDCDDGDPAVNPAAAERCDGAGVDEDCDGLVDDEDDAPEDVVEHYADVDADGWGDPADVAASCVVPAGRVAQPGDCADADPGLNPDQAEACGDGLDNDCDGVGGCTPFVGSSRADAAAGGGLTWLTGGTGYAHQLADVNDDGRAEVAAATTYGGPAGYGAVYLGQAERGAVVSLDSDGLGVILGAEGGPVGLGLAVGRLLRGGGWGVATADYSGNVYIFAVDDLRGGRELGVADAARSGSGLYLGSEDAIPLAAADFTGDGLDELIVGASQVYGSEYAGLVATFRGGDTGALSASGAYGAIFGRRAGSSSFGTSVAGGDLTGDGLPELVAADSWGYVDSTGGYDGYVTVFENGGVRGVGSAEDADLVIEAATSGEGLGWQLAVFDVNDDGYGDLYTGQAGGTAGCVFTTGASGTLLSTDASLRFEGDSSYANSSVWAGDLDSDGDTDLVLGSLADGTGGTFAGALFVRYGPVRLGTYAADAGDATIYGATAYGYFGFRGALGDVDGDGGLDIVARAGDGSGSAVFFGGEF